MKKEQLITALVIGIVLLLVGIIIYFKFTGFAITENNINENIAKYIGEHSVLYVQLGCHACEVQKELFGNSYQYLTTIDCLTDTQSCIDAEIEATPTWIIDNQKYVGVQSIERLKELTGYKE